MSNEVTIIKSQICRHPRIIWTILKNIPTLDPLVIFMNPSIYILYDSNLIAGFIAIKNWGNLIERGTLYVYPPHRGKGYGQQLCAEVMKEYRDVYLLCKPERVPIYLRNGFSVVSNPTGVMKMRQQLNTWFIAPFTGYKIVVMKNHPR